MQFYCENLNEYKRLVTREVTVGSLKIGGQNPIAVQTMTTTDTMDTSATVLQTIRCIKAGAELVRITAPSKKEAENLRNIHTALKEAGYNVPLVADIHYTPNAAEIAAAIVEKVRVNPGNYVDKKKFEQLEFTDEEYAEEIERIRERFTPLVLICKQYGTAMRIGTNHGSLSDRIMSRYGDTAKGMVESAMEFLRIARSENYHEIILSMKSSNPLVMVEAYRLLVHQMHNEFGECYPLHLGVTEAGEGEDGRIKSAIGIGTLLEDGIGDTIRVSLTEDPEFEIPVCKELVKKYKNIPKSGGVLPIARLSYNPFDYVKRESKNVVNIGARNVPVVISAFNGTKPEDLKSIGYNYDSITDKWQITDAAADYIYVGAQEFDIPLPGSLRIICDSDVWQTSMDGSVFPLFNKMEYLSASGTSSYLNFLDLDANDFDEDLFGRIQTDETIVICLSSKEWNGMQRMRYVINQLKNRKILCPVLITINSDKLLVEEQLIFFSMQTGGLFIDGMGDGIWLMNEKSQSGTQTEKRSISELNDNRTFLNNTSFSILQAVRQRISKTEYISCPSCGRTLFDLQETTAKIRQVTSHLKGLKIAIMGCIVNGPGEMADADFGYVGSGIGKITLYKGKDIVKRNVDSDIAVEELISLLKENNVWTDPVIQMA